VLKLENISKSFQDKIVLNDINYTFADNLIYGLIGPSAGGKSTLLKIISGILDYDSGRIVYEKISKEDISLMFQEGALFDSLSVFDNVAFNLVHGRVPTSLLSKELRPAIEEKVSNILARVGLTAACHKMPSQLSGGMRRRASLARALVSKPRLVLLDDPTAGLDPIASSVIMELIVEMQKEYNPTMIIVSHDLRRLLPNCQQIIGLFDGEFKFNGKLEEIENADSQVKHFISCRFDLNHKGYSIDSSATK
jgi:phospholipid/cholesterol/gamma-HCH transport system ATP-binding protein